MALSRLTAAPRINTARSRTIPISCRGVLAVPYQDVFRNGHWHLAQPAGFSASACRRWRSWSCRLQRSGFRQSTGFNGGGAINQDGPISAQIYYATIHNNTAAFGAGLYKDGAATGTLFIGRSIVSANSGRNCDGVVRSNCYNVVNDTGCGGFVETGDLQNANVPLLAFGNHGGPTPSSPPSAGNAAIDRIPIADCISTADQRGAPRPAGSGCDSGAFEFGTIVPTPTIFMIGFE